MEDKTWIIIPARGGSREIPRKNLARCGGKPLIQYVIDTAIDVVGDSHVVVISDDPEIDWFAQKMGVITVREYVQSSPQETLDEKVVRNIPELRAIGVGSDDFVLTVQPTSPLVRAESISKAVHMLLDGAGSVISVVEDRHLSWGISHESRRPEPLFSSRVNRQDIEPIFRETGGIIGARLKHIESEKTRVVDPIALVTVSSREGVDIDSHGDLFEAEHWLTRSKVVIRADVGVRLGMGHLYRGLAIAQELSRHEILLALAGDKEIIDAVLGKYPFTTVLLRDEEDFLRLLQDKKPELLISDVLDTTASQVRGWRESSPLTKIITFEDEGPGARHCDAQVYDLTAPGVGHDSTAICGIDKSIISPSFELVAGAHSSEPPQSEILVTFGGSDPAGLTGKVLDALELLNFNGSITVVCGLGAKKPELAGRRLNVNFLENVSNMALVMAGHRLAISSMGRTVFELATCGVPVLCFAQNEKEARHIHIGEQTGSVYGGLGFTLSPAEIAQKVGAFIADASLHENLRRGAEPFRGARSNRRALEEVLLAAGLSHLA